VKGEDGVLAVEHISLLRAGWVRHTALVLISP